MTKKQARELGKAAALEAGRYGEFTPTELSDFDAFAGAMLEILENQRQYAYHPGYRFSREPNADSLWDGFEAGEEVGIRLVWRALKHY